MIFKLGATMPYVLALDQRLQGEWSYCPEPEERTGPSVVVASGV